MLRLLSLFALAKDVRTDWVGKNNSVELII